MTEEKREKKEKKNAKRAFCALIQVQAELLKIISLNIINIDEIIENISTLQTIIAGHLFPDFEEFKEMLKESDDVCRAIQVPNHDGAEVLYNFDKEARA